MRVKPTIQMTVQGDYIQSTEIQNSIVDSTLQDSSVVSRSEVGNEAGDLMAQLERLGEMKKEGLLTDDEFKAAKEKLLKDS